MDAELEVYSRQTTWLLLEFARNLDETAPALWDAAPPGTLEGNNLLAIARHAAAVTQAYALGLGCGLAVQRDRSREFTATAAEGPTIVAQLRALESEIPRAFAALDPGSLGRTVVPPQDLYGSGQPRPMTPREAIVENIRHLGIHLGELRLTRSLLEAGHRAD